MARDRWFLREPDGGAPARLFCLPYSGCGASMYRLWPQWFGAVEVCPVQLPGRENRMREPTFETYEALADELIPALLPRMDRPFAFFGHCGSALAGFEATVRLAERGGPLPVRLFMSSQVAPHEGPYGRFLHMDDDGLAEEMRALVREMGSEPLPDLIELCLGVMRADVEANRRYRKPTAVRLACPITAIGWRDDRDVAPSQMSGWAACGDATFRVLDGGHFRFLEAPPELAAVIVDGFGRAAGDLTSLRR
jgi:surfactin synthase thioesterase subunit